MTSLTDVLVRQRLAEADRHAVARHRRDGALLRVRRRERRRRDDDLVTSLQQIIHAGRAPPTR